MEKIKTPLRQILLPIGTVLITAVILSCFVWFSFAILPGILLNWLSVKLQKKSKKS